MPKNPFIFNGLQLIISLMNIWTLEEAENMKFLWKHLVANSSKYSVGWYLLVIYITKCDVCGCLELYNMSIITTL